VNTLGAIKRLEKLGRLTRDEHGMYKCDFPSGKSIRFFDQEGTIVAMGIWRDNDMLGGNCSLKRAIESAS